MKKIEDPLKYINENLSEGISNRKSPFHLAVLSYFYNRKSYACNIVLRDFNKEKNTLRFNADFRSQKIKALKLDPSIQLHFYDPLISCQLRVSATANIIHNNNQSLSLWNKLSDMSRHCYLQKGVPGSEIVDSKSDTLSDADGYNNFCLVVLSINSFDFLVLDSSGHDRCIIKFPNNSVPKISYVYP